MILQFYNTCRTGPIFKGYLTKGGKIIPYFGLRHQSCQKFIKIFSELICLWPNGFSSL